MAGSSVEVKPEGTKKNRDAKSILKSIGDVFWVFAVTLATFFLFITLIFPLILGARPTTVITQSMEPNINPGDVAMVKRDYPLKDIKIGDVVEIYEKSGETKTFTHRVIGVTFAPEEKTGYLFTTQGDHNTAPDPPIKGERIKGKVVDWPGSDVLYVVPKVGLIINYPIQTAIAFVVFFTAIGVGSAMSKRRQKREELSNKTLQEQEMTEMRAEMAKLKAEREAREADSVQPPVPAVTVADDHRENTTTESVSNDAVVDETTADETTVTETHVVDDPTSPPSESTDQNNN